MNIFVVISDALLALVPFIQFKKRERHPWESVTLRKVAGFRLLHGCLSRFLNFTNGIKPRKASHIKIFSWFLVNSNLTLLLKASTLSWRRPLSYRNQSIDLQSKSVNWFLYDKDLHHERVKIISVLWWAK